MLDLTTTPSLKLPRQLRTITERLTSLCTRLLTVPRSQSLFETSCKGYLAASSASAYSFVSLLQKFGPIMKEGGNVLSSTYIASEKVIPGYGGGMWLAASTDSASTPSALDPSSRELLLPLARNPVPRLSLSWPLTTPRPTPLLDRIFTVTMSETPPFSCAPPLPEVSQASPYTSTTDFMLWEWLLTVNPWNSKYRDKPHCTHL
jgi:hypothetical protein